MDIIKTDVINKYHIVDMDNAVYPYYFGFLNDIGDWYIMRISITGDVRYNKPGFQGVGLYSSAWMNRINLQYTYWNEGF